MKKNKPKTGTDLSRRHFIRNAGIGAASATALPALLASCTDTRPKDGSVSGYFSRDDIILFQGDSITDASREKEKELPNDARSFGNGYAFIIASRLLKDLADKNLTIYNRGISGNKVFQLAERWQKDCLDLKPDVLSILIGVNDYWHMRQGRYEGTPEIYENDYRALLERTKTELPDIKLVICEPFILTGTTDVDESWVEPFSHYQEIAVKMADEFNAVWVPFQTAFDESLSMAPASYWAADGVHPSMPGCRLMADTWLKAVAS
jgi:lysophospholipase L1-like esterase